MTNIEKAGLLRELIRYLERKFGILEDGELSCCGISMAQCHALVEIGRAGSISLIDLAKLLDLDSSTMSRTVNGLVRNEIVERELDPGDRRYVTIKLTSKGMKSFDEIESNMRSYFLNILEAIPNNKQEQVIESMQLLLNAMTKLSHFDGGGLKS